MTYPSVYPTGVTVYNPAKCWSGYTIFQARELGAMLIDMNGAEVQLWKGLHGFPNKMLPGGYVLGHTGERNNAFGMQDQVDLVQVDWEGNIVWKFNQLEYIEDPGEEPGRCDEGTGRGHPGPRALQGRLGLPADGRDLRPEAEARKPAFRLLRGEQPGSGDDGGRTGIGLGGGVEGQPQSRYQQGPGVHHKPLVTDENEGRAGFDPEHRLRLGIHGCPVRRHDLGQSPENRRACKDKPGGSHHLP